MSTTTITAVRPRGAHRAGIDTVAAPARTGRHQVAAAPHRTRRVLTVLTRTLVNLLLVSAVLALLGLAVGPRFLPYRTTTMLTGSMVPLIHPGDVAVITSEPAADVRVGQILQIQAPLADHRVVTHRVVEVRHHGDGTVWIRTKGDANQGVDPWLAELTGPTVWQYRFTIPHLGTAIRALRHPTVERTLIFGIPAGLAIWVLAGVWRKDEDEQ